MDKKIDYKKLVENANLFDAKEITPLYHNGKFLLVDVDKKLYFIYDKTAYEISSYYSEPCMYVYFPDGSRTVIHHGLEISQIYSLVDSNHTNEAIRTSTGNEYDMQRICDTILCAIQLSCESCSVCDLEELVVIEKLKEMGAVSANTAIDLKILGIRNENIMLTSLKENKVKKTEDGKYYLLSDNT